jgi:hypothetical protein
MTDFPVGTRVVTPFEPQIMEVVFVEGEDRRQCKWELANGQSEVKTYRVSDLHDVRNCLRILARVEAPIA